MHTIVHPHTYKATHRPHPGLSPSAYPTRMADLEPHPGYHRDHLITDTRRDSTAPSKNSLDCPPGSLPNMGTHTATPSPHATDFISHSLANESQWVRFQSTRDPPSRLGGGKPFNCLITLRQYSRKYRNTSELHKHRTTLATFETSPQDRDLPYIKKIEDRAHLLQTHTHSEFASLANK
jgi:hypothetical protein